MKRIKLYGKTLILATAMLLMTPLAQAQDASAFETPDDTINVIGLAVAAVPDFYGSDKHKGRAAPLFRYHLYDSQRFVQLLGPELSLNLVDSKVWRAGPLIRARERRDDDVDDAIVKRMRPIATATEVGAFGQYYIFLDPNNKMHKIQFAVDAVWNTNHVYGGATGNVRVNYYYPFPTSWVGQQMIGTIGFGMFFASAGFNERYFGVTGSDLPLFPSRAGVPYTPDRGLTSLKIPFTLSARFQHNWLGTIGGRYERLVGDAEDSPVVRQHGSANQWILGAAVSYLF